MLGAHRESDLLHGLHDLGPVLGTLLKAHTVIHNFVLRRDDGTTAAERLFGVPHADLFEHLLGVIPPLPLPRTRMG